MYNRPDGSGAVQHFVIIYRWLARTKSVGGNGLRIWSCILTERCCGERNCIGSWQSSLKNVCIIDLYSYKLCASTLINWAFHKMLTSRRSILFAFYPKFTDMHTCLCNWMYLYLYLRLRQLPSCSCLLFAVSPCWGAPMSCLVSAGSSRRCLIANCNSRCPPSRSV